MEELTMRSEHVVHRDPKTYLAVFLVVLTSIFAGACQEVDTIKRELKKKFVTKILKIKRPFVPRDGITTRSCSLYQTANPNSPVIGRLPAETPLHLVDRIGEWYRVRTRDGREGYLDHKMVAGEEIILKTQQLRRSIEGMPVQAEGVVRNKANFRLTPGRQHQVLDLLPPGKKFEMYERVVTLRQNPMLSRRVAAGGTEGEAGKRSDEVADENDSGLDDLVKKDVWYKVKLEDARVGYIYTHNIRFTPPEDIERLVPFMRVLAWRTVSVTDDPDRGAKNNYVAAYAPVGKDPGCDYTRLYLMNWSKRLKRHVIVWKLRRPGILPITNYHFEGLPGFSVRFLHPSKRDKLVLASFVLSKGSARKVSEEEIPNKSILH
jgi:hypothetical protein